MVSSEMRVLLAAPAIQLQVWLRGAQSPGIDRSQTDPVISSTAFSSHHAEILGDPISLKMYSSRALGHPAL